VYLRFFSTALDPSDLAEVGRIFTEDIEPVFAALPGCRSIELMVSTASNPGGLLDGVLVSRWDGLKALTEGVATRVVAESMVRVLPYLQIEPVIKVFEVLE
jgi:quinol monooxygenase YgiN